MKLLSLLFANLLAFFLLAGYFVDGLHSRLHHFKAAHCVEGGKAADDLQQRAGASSRRPRLHRIAFCLCQQFGRASAVS